MRWRPRRRRRRRDPRVERVVICTPDKDLAQCVRGTRVVQLDRRKRDDPRRSGVIAKFGVPPASIPDYLALVGDTSDGYPGLPGWGAKSAAAVLARFGHLESIPADWRDWKRQRRQPRRAGATLAREREHALALPRPRDAAHRHSAVRIVDDLEWSGADGRVRRARRAIRGGDGRPAFKKTALPFLSFPVVFPKELCHAPIGNPMGEGKARSLAGHARPDGAEDARSAGPQHGYGIARRIEQTSGDRLVVNHGTLYPRS